MRIGDEVTAHYVGTAGRALSRSGLQGAAAVVQLVLFAVAVLWVGHWLVTGTAGALWYLTCLWSGEPTHAGLAIQSLGLTASLALMAAPVVALAGSALAFGGKRGKVIAGRLLVLGVPLLAFMAYSGEFLANASYQEVHPGYSLVQDRACHARAASGHVSPPARSADGCAAYLDAAGMDALCKPVLQAGVPLDWENVSCAETARRRLGMPNWGVRGMVVGRSPEEWRPSLGEASPAQRLAALKAHGWEYRPAR